MRASLAALSALNAETVLYCHAPVTMGPQLIQDNIDYFDRVEAHCRAALARGIPAEPDEDVDVIALIGCTYEDVTPKGRHWEDVREFYKADGHAQQIRMMLEVLSNGHA